jgi:hypothetical protein
MLVGLNGPPLMRAGRAFKELERFAGVDGVLDAH